jgi:hypothetical protein
MKMRILLATAAAIAVVAPHAVRAADPFVRIIEPADGARLDAMALNRLVYKVDPGPGGDHVHVYADDKEIGILRRLEGSYTLETLRPGPQTLCIKVVNKAHTPIGVQQCVKVTVE